MQLFDCEYTSSYLAAQIYFRAGLCGRRGIVKNRNSNIK